MIVTVPTFDGTFWFAPAVTEYFELLVVLPEAVVALYLNVTVQSALTVPDWFSALTYSYPEYVFGS